MITDDKNNLTEFATVYLKKDTTILQTTISNSKGFFYFENLQKNTSYTISISLIGYKIFDTIITTIYTNNKINIHLQKDYSELKTVIISSKKPLIERKLDKIIFNVENSIVGSSGSVWDAVKRSPGVILIGEYSLNTLGKSISILIDGKILHFSPSEASNYLQSIPASNIKLIEVIPNPSAKYDAESGAILNIIFKKPKLGYSGSFSSEYIQNKYPKILLGTNLNYSSNKIDCFINYNINEDKSYKFRENYTSYKSFNNYSQWNTDEKRTTSNKNNILKTGLQYNINEKKSIGFMYDASIIQFNPIINSQTTITNNLGNIDSILYNKNIINTKENQHSFNINYKSLIDTLGKQIDVLFDLTLFSNISNQSLESKSYLNNLQLSNPISFNTSEKQPANIYSGQFNYTHPFDSTMQFQIGAKISFIKNNNSINLYNRLNGNFNVLDSSKTNSFIYTENTQALYALVSKDLNKISFNIGTRIELTQTTGNSLTLSRLTKNNYFKLFPSAFLEYRFNESHQLDFSISSKIGRPEYYRLNPAIIFYTPYYTQVGNPSLLPAYINSAMLTYTLNNKYSFTIYTTNTKNNFANIPYQNNSNYQYTIRQLNIANELVQGFNTSIPIDILTFWQLNAFLQIENKKIASSYENAEIKYNFWSLNSSLQNSFTISHPKAITAEIIFWYTSPNYQGIYHFDKTWDLSFSIKKSFKNNSTISFSLYDLFYTNYLVNNVNFNNQISGFKEYNDTRMFKLVYSKRIGNYKVKDFKKHQKSNQEEIDRIK